MKPLPNWIEKFINKIAPSELSEFILGDLEEQYSEYQTIYSRRKAKWKIFWDSLLFLRPGILLRNKLRHSYKIIMLTTHIKIGLRSIGKQKLYSSINAIGLGIAIAFSTLIYLYIQDEKSFDQWHTYKERIFRINSVDYDKLWSSEPKTRHAYVQTPLAIALREEAPEIEKVTRFNAGGLAILKTDDQVFSEEISFTDPEFFQMFDFDILYGNSSKLLKEKYDIVISETASQKYFGDKNPVGNSIEIELYGSVNNFTISGVIEDAPHNSSIDYRDIIMRQEIQPYYENNLSQWRSRNNPTFVQLHNINQVDQLRESLKNIDLKYYYPTQSEVDEETYIKNYRPIYDVTSLEDIHMENEVSFHKVSDPLYTWILSGIGFLILSIACINYVTLSIASSARKRLEVGIRKTVGSSRKELISQFMIESLLLSILSMAIAALLIIIFLPLFNEFSGKAIDFTESLPETLLALTIFSISIGIIAGIYPAIFLSGFKPMAMLKNHGSSRFSSSWTKPMVGFQFLISASLVICSLVMNRQMNFITSKDLGFSDDQVLVIPTHTGYNDDGEKILNRFKQAISAHPTIHSVTGTSTSFARGWSRNGYTIDEEYHLAYVYRVDHDYINTLKMSLAEGRNFDPERISDKERSIIVNEALVKDIGWDNPIGERLNWRDSLGHEVIGVVKDYHFLPLTNEIEPLILGIGDHTGKIFNILVKIDGKDLQGGIAAIQTIWEEVSEGKPFDYNFMDEDIDSQYASFTKWSSIMGVTTLFAILIACLGLFGLAGVTTINRTREIGIRKAMGAEVKHILIMINRPYLIISLISFLIAAPLSWMTMEKWLSEFQYGINLEGSYFIISFVSMTLFALLTVSFHSFKASMINPAETLKTE